MITAVLFAFHFLFAVIIFTKKWQEDGTGSALLNIALIAILFAVGWTITGLVSKMLLEPEGFGLFFDRDTFSLTLLTIVEFFFYKFYYSEKSTAADTEKQ